MSNISQLFTTEQNAGGPAPVGSVTTLFAAFGKPLIQNGSELYLQTGATVAYPTDSVMQLTKATGYGFDVPCVGTALTAAGSSTDSQSVGINTQSIVSNNGIFVRASVNGANITPAGVGNSLLFSTDGISWTISNGLQGATVLSTITVFNNAFYIIADSIGSTGVAVCPAVYKSVDGDNWQLMYYLTPLTTAVSTLSVANGILFAAIATKYSTGFYLFSSADGTVWKQVLSTALTNVFTISNVVYGSGVYVVSCARNNNGNGLLYSTDGLTWQLSSGTNTDSIEEVAFLNGIWFAIGITGGSAHVIYTSTNGSTWTLRSTGGGGFGSNNSIAWNGSTGSPQYICTVVGGIKRSTNGTSWTTDTLSGNHQQVIFAASKFVFTNAGPTALTLFTTVPGSGTYTSRTIPFTAAAGFIPVSRSKKLYHDGTNFWLIDGHGSIARSSDAETWTKVFSSAPVTFVSGSVEPAIKLVNGRVFMLPSTGGIQVATAGTDSFKQVLNITTALRGVTYGSNMYVAVGSGVIYSSPDAETWTQRVTGGAAYTGVATNGSMFVAGVNNTTAGSYSTDGITWTPTVSAGNNGHPAAYLGYANGFWASIVGSNSSSYQTSTDGINWSNRASAAQASRMQVIGDLFWTTGGQVALISAPTRTITGSANNFGAYSSQSPVIGYNKLTDTYMVLSGNTIFMSSAVGKESAMLATGGWRVGSGVSAATLQGSAGISYTGVFTNGSMCEMPGTSNTLFVTSNRLGVSIGGSHFSNIAGANTVVAHNTTLASCSFCTSTALYTSINTTGQVVFMKRNALTTGIPRISSGATPAFSFAGNQGYSSHFRRIA